MKVSTLTFEELDLSPELLSGLRDVNYEKPTELQESVIPVALEGKDILFNAENGKGVNGAFIIPALEKLIRSKDKEGCRILVLTPHSEDANTIDELVWAMGYHAQIDCAPIELNGDEKEQVQAIKNGVQVLAVNPGRLVEIMEENRFILRDVEMLVIDRVHEMISLNLISRIDDILKRVISEYQTLMVTSELNNDVKEFADRILDEPVLVGFEGVASDSAGLNVPPSVPKELKQGYILVPSRMKISTLMAHIEKTPTDTCVIFTASKRGTDRLYRVFRKRGLKATSIHEKLSDDKRNQRFSNFVNGDVQYLLVADISASELALDGVTQVINYDVPNDPDEYRYRTGLVGSGKAGRIVSLVSKQDRSDIGQLKNELGQAPQELPLPGKVKQKLQERKKSKRSKKKQKKKRGKSRQKRDREKKMELPRPSYDKLSGGRSGKKKEKEEEKGLIGFFKKLFS